MLERPVYYGTRLLTGDEICIYFSLKLIMAQVRMVLLSPRKQLRCLCELSTEAMWGPGKWHIFPLLKALLAAVSGVKGRRFAVD